jgi:hypothetical protein
MILRRQNAAVADGYPEHRFAGHVFTGLATTPIFVAQRPAVGGVATLAKR